MQELVTRETFIKDNNLDKWNLRVAAGPLMKLSGMARMNALYDELHRLEGIQFIEGFLNNLRIQVDVLGKGMKKIPKEGPFIVVSNHPFGFLDELILLRTILRIRPDLKINSSHLLNQIPQIKNLLLSGDKEGQFQSDVKAHLQQGGCLAVFPSGDASSYQLKGNSITDKGWDRSLIKMIRQAGVPIIPVHFEGRNSAVFQLLGLIHPRLQQAAIPNETLKLQDTTIKLRIGSPIKYKEQKKIAGSHRFGRYLRARVYSLDSDLEVAPFFQQAFTFPKKQKEVALPESKSAIIGEVESLRKRQAALCQQGEFEVFVARATEIPTGLQEIGRRREITFREVGEGTGLSRDLDEYDLYYLHLFLWDTDNQEIAGAYRMGPGDEIVQNYGKRGFYSFSLFRMKKQMSPILAGSLELGRSFILPEYQKKRLPLFLLWKGIRQFLHLHPQYRYLIGPVSISNDYTHSSKSFMVAFIREHFFDHDLSAHIRPRKRFKPQLRHVDMEALLSGTDADLKAADQLVDEMEPSHARLPILLKKYIKQNAKIIGFNVDPKFMNALDGLIVLDIQNLPEETEKMYG